jgi:Cu/Ag efflux protein CusF
MKIFFLLILVFGFAGCGATKPKPAAESPVPTASVPKNGNYNGKGVVTKINLKLVSVELDHEEIKVLMPPMLMEFFVKEKSELEQLAVGDKVEFVVNYKDGQEKITSIKKTE